MAKDPQLDISETLIEAFQDDMFTGKLSSGVERIVSCPSGECLCQCLKQ